VQTSSSISYGGEFLSRLEKHSKANEKVIWSGKAVKKEFVMPMLEPPLHEEKKGIS